MNKSKFDLVRDHVKQQRHDEYILTEQKLIDRINEVFIDREAEILNWFAYSTLSNKGYIVINEIQLYEIIFGDKNVPNDVYEIRSMKITKLLKKRLKSLGLFLSYRADSFYNQTLYIWTDKYTRKLFFGLAIFLVVLGLVYGVLNSIYKGVNYGK